MTEILAQCCVALPDWGVANRDLVWSRMAESKRDRAVRDLGQAPGGFIAAVFPYYSGSEAGNISLYARGPDYHEVVGARLDGVARALEAAFPDRRFLPYADASPYPEVLAAASAGLGVIGDNTLLIHPRWGSYVFIGLIATDLPLAGEGGEPGECLHCGKCFFACPGGALGPDGLDRDKCVSHLTQKKGALDQEALGLIRRAGMAWGCDRCQLCCPLNRGVEPAGENDFSRDLISSLATDDIPPDREAFLRKYGGRAFTWRGPEVLRRNLALWDEDV